MAKGLGGLSPNGNPSWPRAPLSPLGQARRLTALVHTGPGIDATFRPSSGFAPGQYSRNLFGPGAPPSGHYGEQDWYAGLGSPSSNEGRDWIRDESFKVTSPGSKTWSNKNSRPFGELVNRSIGEVITYDLVGLPNAFAGDADTSGFSPRDRRGVMIQCGASDGPVRPTSPGSLKASMAEVGTPGSVYTPQQRDLINSSRERGRLRSISLGVPEGERKGRDF